MVCCNCLLLVAEEDGRVQENTLLLACPRTIAVDEATRSDIGAGDQEEHEDPQEDTLCDVCPGCVASGRARRCRQCDETMCECCVNEGELCYMCDGAYPGATSREHDETRESERGEPTQVLAGDGGHRNFYLHAYDPEWCRRFCLHCGVFGRGPLMQLSTALLIAAASIWAWFGRRGE